MTPKSLASESISRRISQALTCVSRRPDASLGSAYFLSKIDNVKSAAASNDLRLFNIAMQTFGHSDLSCARAMIYEVLEQDADQSNSLATRLADQSFKDLAQTFKFERCRETATIFCRARQGAVNRYMPLGFEDEAGQDNECVRLTPKFERKIGQLPSGYGMLADRAMVKVATAAVQPPNGFDFFAMDKQANILASRICVRDFAIAGVRATFLRRFTALRDISNPTSSNAAFASLSGSCAIGIGNRCDIGVKLLQTIQAIKRGPR